MAEVCRQLDGKSSEDGLLIVIGPSGAGKTSLLRAGVIPAIERGALPAAGSRHWPRLVLTPASDPFLALAKQVILAAAGGRKSADQQDEEPQDPGAEHARPEDAARSWASAPGECDRALRRLLPRGAGRVLVMVDQFEEVFTLCAEEQSRRGFIGLLDLLAKRPATGEDPVATVLICVRADFYDQCIRYEPLRAALRESPVILDPMSAAELREAIVFPARQAGLEVEPGLTEILLRDAGMVMDALSAGGTGADRAGRLPLLAHALRGTWQQRHGHLLTVEGYEITGGIKNAVATTAEQVFNSLEPGGQQLARILFLRLVKLGENVDAVRRRLTRSDLLRALPSAPATAVMIAFTRARLLAHETDSVTITHEALLSAWPRLRAWLDEDRAGNIIRQDLDEAAAAWDRDGRESWALYRGSRLAAAVEWATGHSPDLTAIASDFLTVSRRAQQRAARGRRIASVALASLLLIAVASTAIAAEQLKTARAQARIATARQLAATSGALLPAHLDIAQLLAVASYQADQDMQARAALLQASAASPHLVRYVQAGAPVTALASSADGSALVAGTANGGLLWMDLRTGRRAAIRATLGAVASLSVSGDGRAIVAADAAEAVTWAPGTQGAIPVEGIHSPSDVAISPSGRIMAVLEPSGVRSWLVLVHEANGTWRTIQIPGGFGETRVAFPSESSIKLVDSDGSSRQVNPETLQVTATDKSSLLGPMLSGTEYATSPDGNYSGMLITGEANTYTAISVRGTAGTPGGRAVRAGTGPAQATAGWAIRADGRAAAVPYADGTIDVVSLTAGHPAGTEPEQFTGNAGTDLITFLGRTAKLASAAGPTIALWDTAQDSRLGTPVGLAVPLGSDASGPPVLLGSPDGTWVSLVGDDAGDAVTPFTSALLVPNGQWRQAQHAAPRARWQLPMRNGNEPLLLGWADPSGTGHGHLVLAGADGNILQSWPIAAELDAVAAGMLPGGNKLAVVASDRSVRILDRVSGAVRQLARGDPGSYLFPQDSAVSPDGRAAIFLDYRTEAIASNDVKYMDLRSGAVRVIGAGGALGIVFTHDGLLIQRASGALEVWDSGGRKLQRTLPSLGGDTGALAVSPDGALLARLQMDGTVLISDFRTNDILGSFTLPVPAQSIGSYPLAKTGMLFTQDGRYLVTATSGGQLIQWTMDPAGLMKKICATVGHGLMPAQWQQYAHANLPAHMPCSS